MSRVCFWVIRVQRDSGFADTPGHSRVSLSRPGGRHVNTLMQVAVVPKLICSWGVPYMYEIEVKSVHFMLIHAQSRAAMHMPRGPSRPPNPPSPKNASQHNTPHHATHNRTARYLPTLETFRPPRLTPPSPPPSSSSSPRSQYCRPRTWLC